MLKSKLVLTGGQCAGKTTLVNIIKKKDTKRQYIVVTETAMLLYCSNLKLGKDISDYGFQKLLVLIQYYKEYKAELEAEKLKGERFIVCDRGLLDSIAYSSEEEYRQILDELELDYDNIVNSYDSILFMQSLAVDRPSLYKMKRNAKGLKLVVKRNDKLREIWKSTNLYMDFIDNPSDDFYEKAVMAMHYLSFPGTNKNRVSLKPMGRKTFYKKLHQILKEEGLDENRLDEYLESRGI